MPLAEGGESISGDLKIDLRRLKNHSKQIDFSFSADLYGRLWRWGNGLYLVIFTTKSRGGPPLRIFFLFFFPFVRFSRLNQAFLMPNWSSAP